MVSRGRKRTGPTARVAQVGEEIREILCSALHEGAIRDRRVTSASMVTITGVDMSPDLREARVFVSIFPDDAEAVERVLEGLRSAARELQRELAARLSLRFVPRLAFGYDGSIRRGAEMEQLLREVHAADAGRTHDSADSSNGD